MKIVIFAKGNQYENYSLLEKQYIEYLTPYYHLFLAEPRLIIAEDHPFKEELKVEQIGVSAKDFDGDDLILIHSTDLLVLDYWSFVEYQRNFEQAILWQMGEMTDGILLKERDLKTIIGDDDHFFTIDALEKIKLRLSQGETQKIPSYQNFLLMYKLKAVSYAFERFCADYRNQLFEEGVFFVNPRTSIVSCDVKVGKGTTILPNCYITGDSVIGEHCVIGPSAIIHNTRIGNNVTIKSSTLTDSIVGDQTTIGPYSQLRPQSEIGRNCKIGDFVEIKNTRIANGSKVPHLSYVGDGIVGENVNIGCGTVFVNYDGKNKHQTVVKDNAFIGCNSNLIAPVTVEKGAYVAAGSTITDSVPEKSLAIARARQIIKAQWTRKK